jgi:predicted dehydrogenase
MKKECSAIRWLVYGTGFISQQLVQAINSVDGNEVYAVVSRNKGRGAEFAKQHDIPVVSDSFADAIQDPSVDVVYIATPNHLHAESIMHGFTAGKPVLCEKPLTVNAKQCRIIQACAKESGLVCMEALMYHYHPVAAKLRRLVSDSPIGKIELFDASFSDRIFSFANPIAGGSIMDLGCYPVSLVLSLVKAYLGLEKIETNLWHAVGQLDKKTNTDAFASCQLGFPANISATIKSSNRFGLDSSFRILGETGMIEVDNPWLADKVTTIRISFFDDRAPQKIQVTADRSLYAYEVETMAAIVRGESVPDNAISLDHSLDIMSVLDAWRAAIGLNYAVEKKESQHETIR